MLGRMLLDDIAAFREWAWSHPYTIAFAFGCVGAVVNWVGKPRSAAEYAAMSPRRAAFFKVTSAIFPDLAKMLDGARHLLQNTRPGDAPNVVLIGQATIEQTAATIITKALEAQQRRAEVRARDGSSGSA